MSDVGDTIRGVLAERGHLSGSATKLKDHEDLYERGLTSHASVNVLLALEDAFDVEFPDPLMKKETFRSVGAIRDALGSLGVDNSSA